MLTFKKGLVAIILLALFSTATMVSCGKPANTEEGNTEQAADSAEHPSDSTEHPTDDAEHPADSTKNQ